MATRGQPPKEDVRTLLHVQLERNRKLRSNEPPSAAHKSMLNALREWQTARLARTYADLLDDSRYRPAAQFFLSDIYGSRDFTERDENVERVYPLMVRLLPEAALSTIALAIEANALTTELDRSLAANLLPIMGRRRRIDAATYAQAYRDSADRRQRLHQIDLIVRVGRALDAVVAKPLIYPTLKMMRKPAKAAGFGELQDFLERGFVAFRHMGGADAFLATVAEREKRIMRHIYAADPDPFGFGD